MMSNPDVEAQAQDQADSSEEQIAPSSGTPGYVTPGHILREAREEQQLNRARVGQGLGLTETAVKNLESNKFELFPGSVYVRGYLKNYARLLDLSEEELLGIYDKYCHDHDLDTGNSTMEAMPENQKSGSAQRALFTVLAVGVLTAIVFIFIGSFA